MAIIREERGEDKTTLGTGVGRQGASLPLSTPYEEKFCSRSRQISQVGGSITGRDGPTKLAQKRGSVHSLVLCRGARPWCCAWSGLFHLYSLAGWWGEIINRRIAAAIGAFTGLCPVSPLDFHCKSTFEPFRENALYKCIIIISIIIIWCYTVTIAPGQAYPLDYIYELII